MAILGLQSKTDCFIHGAKLGADLQQLVIATDFLQRQQGIDISKSQVVQQARTLVNEVLIDLDNDGCTPNRDNLMKELNLIHSGLLSAEGRKEFVDIADNVAFVFEMITKEKAS